MIPSRVAAHRKGLDVVSVGADFITPLQPDGQFAFLIWPNLALALKVAGHENRSLAIRLAGGPIAGRQSQNFLGPDGAEVETDSRSAAGALFELGLQLRLLTSGRYRPSLDAGFQLGGVG